MYDCGKRFEDRETIWGIKLSLLDEIPFLYHYWWDHCTKKRVYWLSGIKGKEDMKDIWCIS